MNINVQKVLKVAKHFVGPAVSAVFAFSSEIENQNLKQTVAKLSKEVAELKKR